MIVFIILITVIVLRVCGEFGGVAGGSFLFLALLRFLFALAAMLFPCVENRFQPRKDFLEGGQAAGRPLLAARALRAHGALLALRPFRAARALRAGFA